MYLTDHKDEYLVKNRIGDVRCGKNVYILTNTHWLLCTDRVIQKEKCNSAKNETKEMKKFKLYVNYDEIMEIV